MDHAQVTLPLILVGFAFLLKLFIDRTVKLADVVGAVLELPVDIAFLATSLVAAFTIASPNAAAMGLSLFTVYLIGTLVVVVLWRRSQRNFEGTKYWWSLPLGAVNYCLCLAGIYNAVRLIASVNT